jgi:hypothetical protein
MSQNEDNSEDVAEKPTRRGLFWSALRVFLWTLGGLGLGFIMLGCEIWTERYPLITQWLENIHLPGAWVGMGLLRLGLGPKNEAGMLLIIIAPIYQWAIIGFVCGLVRESWRTARTRSRMAVPAAGRAGGGPRLRGRWRLCLIVAGLVAVAFFAHVVNREMTYAKDREFFRTKVDHKAFAEACLDMVARPEHYSLELGACAGDDPKLPEFIRNLHAREVSYHGYEVSVSRAVYFQALMFTHNRTNAAQYNVILWSNYRPPQLLYSLYSTNRPKVDAR